MLENYQIRFKKREVSMNRYFVYQNQEMSVRTVYNGFGPPYLIEVNKQRHLIFIQFKAISRPIQFANKEKIA